MIEPDAAGEAMYSAGRLHAKAHELDGDRAATLARLRAELEGGESRLALLLMQHLHTDYAIALVDVLVARVLSGRDSMLVREILGRLPRQDAEGVVIQAIRTQLSKTPDEDAHRMLFALLEHLGLDNAVEALAAEALDSEDSEVREVGHEYLGN